MNIAVELEYRAALQDTQCAEREYGQPVQVRLVRESGVTRDSYGSIVGRKSSFIELAQNAARIDYQPTRMQVEKANLRETCEAIIWIAMQDIIDQGLTVDDLDIKRMTVSIGAIDQEVRGQRYEVTEKARASAFGQGYLYCTLGLKRG